jgi:hypothetical protein
MAQRGGGGEGPSGHQSLANKAHSSATIRKHYSRLGHPCDGLKDMHQTSQPSIRHHAILTLFIPREMFADPSACTLGDLSKATPISRAIHDLVWLMAYLCERNRKEGEGSNALVFFELVYRAREGVGAPSFDTLKPKLSEIMGFRLRVALPSGQHTDSEMAYNVQSWMETTLNTMFNMIAIADNQGDPYVRYQKRNTEAKQEGGSGKPPPPLFPTEASRLDFLKKMRFKNRDALKDALTTYCPTLRGAFGPNNTGEWVKRALCLQNATRREMCLDQQTSGKRFGIPSAVYQIAAGEFTTSNYHEFLYPHLSRVDVDRASIRAIQDFHASRTLDQLYEISEQWLDDLKQSADTDDELASRLNTDMAQQLQSFGLSADLAERVFAPHEVGGRLAPFDDHLSVYDFKAYERDLAQLEQLPEGEEKDRLRTIVRSRAHQGENTRILLCVSRCAAQLHLAIPVAMAHANVSELSCTTAQLRTRLTGSHIAVRQALETFKAIEYAKLCSRSNITDYDALKALPEALDQVNQMVTLEHRRLMKAFRVEAVERAWNVFGFGPNQAPADQAAARFLKQFLSESPSENFYMPREPLSADLTPLGNFMAHWARDLERLVGEAFYHPKIMHVTLQVWSAADHGSPGEVPPVKPQAYLHGDFSSGKSHIADMVMLHCVRGTTITLDASSDKIFTPTLQGGVTFDESMKGMIIRMDDLTPEKLIYINNNRTFHQRQNVSSHQQIIEQDESTPFVPKRDAFGMGGAGIVQTALSGLFCRAWTGEQKTSYGRLEKVGDPPTFQRITGEYDLSFMILATGNFQPSILAPPLRSRMAPSHIEAPKREGADAEARQMKPDDMVHVLMRGQEHFKRFHLVHALLRLMYYMFDVGALQPPSKSAMIPLVRKCLNEAGIFKDPDGGPLTRTMDHVMSVAKVLCLVRIIEANLFNPTTAAQNADRPFHATDLLEWEATLIVTQEDVMVAISCFSDRFFHRLTPLVCKLLHDGLLENPIRHQIEHCTRSDKADVTLVDDETRSKKTLPFLPRLFGPTADDYFRLAVLVHQRYVETEGAHADPTLTTEQFQDCLVMLSGIRRQHKDKSLVPVLHCKAVPLFERCYKLEIARQNEEKGIADEKLAAARAEERVKMLLSGGTGQKRKARTSSSGRAAKRSARASDGDQMDEKHVDVDTEVDEDVMAAYRFKRDEIHFLAVVFDHERLDELAKMSPFEGPSQRTFGHVQCEKYPYVLLTSSSYLPWILRTVTLQPNTAYTLKIANPEYVPAAARAVDASLLNTSRATSTMAHVASLNDQGARAKYITYEGGSPADLALEERMRRLGVVVADLPVYRTNDDYFTRLMERQVDGGFSVPHKYPLHQLIPMHIRHADMTQHHLMLLERIQKDTSTSMINYLPADAADGTDETSVDHAVAYAPTSRVLTDAMDATHAMQAFASSRFHCNVPPPAALSLVARYSSELTSAVNIVRTTAQLSVTGSAASRDYLPPPLAMPSLSQPPRLAVVHEEARGGSSRDFDFPTTPAHTDVDMSSAGGDADISF